MKLPEEMPERPNRHPGIATIGVVGYSGGLRFVAIARTERGLYEQLAGYVAEASRTQLFPLDAQFVRTLLKSDEVEAAVAHYFRAVGRRWDSEWLHVGRVQVECGPPRRHVPVEASR